MRSVSHPQGPGIRACSSSLGQLSGAGRPADPGLGHGSGAAGARPFPGGGPLPAVDGPDPRRPLPDRRGGPPAGGGAGFGAAAALLHRPYGGEQPRVRRLRGRQRLPDPGGAAPAPGTVPGALRRRAPPRLGGVPAALPGEPLEELSWWHWVPGADWRHPEGPGSSIDDRLDHPVVQVSLADAEAYAAWAGAALPSETQWEFAARGGLRDRAFSWGDRWRAGLANTWQGSFPSVTRPTMASPAPLRWAASPMATDCRT